MALPYSGAIFIPRRRWSVQNAAGSWDGWIWIATWSRWMSRRRCAGPAIFNSYGKRSGCLVTVALEQSAHPAVHRAAETKRLLTPSFKSSKRVGFVFRHRNRLELAKALSIKHLRKSKKRVLFRRGSLPGRRKFRQLCRIAHRGCASVRRMARAAGNNPFQPCFLACCSKR